MMIDLQAIIGLIVGGASALIVRTKQFRGFLVKIIEVLRRIVELSNEVEKTAKDIQKALEDGELTTEEIEKLKEDITELKRTCEILCEYLETARKVRF